MTEGLGGELGEDIALWKSFALVPLVYASAYLGYLNLTLI